MTDDAAPTQASPDAPTPPPSPAAVSRPRLRELSPKTMWLTAFVIAVLTAAAVVLLWWPATRGLNGAELVSARLDALKVGLSVAVGSGGVVALYLAWRRQYSTEADLDNRERTLAHQQQSHEADLAQRDRVAQAVERDARERRLSELYLKAVEQLGSPQAAVRHGGLYALERVAQDNPHQRQTVVNVICAYLRNPYTPPPKNSQPRPLGIRRPLLRSATVGRSTPAPSRDGGRDAILQEREVRLTAQRILQLHLRPGPNLDQPQPSFWGNLDIDLTGATLINFILDGCAIATATFTGASFIGDAGFGGATFTGRAGFGGATFVGDAEFSGATFTDRAGFGGATFTGRAWFREATFTLAVVFSEATFSRDAEFDWATFRHDVEFGGAAFNGGAGFNGASFTRGVGFRGVTFTSRAAFHGAAFAGRAVFSETAFAYDAVFSEATFTDARFDGAAFTSRVWFDRATFSSNAEFSGAAFNSVAWFNQASFNGNPAFYGATFDGDAWFGEATVDGVSFDPTTP
ncbi:pentapeptide repeat-containing protein [Amycolatopsis sp. NPDC098790]|uniref:pentapeptide repeat-containing protein n=1 Tax=Amycolatopsis sp. NPDC098790 TaxID=3363939 RepID=UPI0038171B45